MLTPRVTLLLSLALLGVFAARASWPQSYPTKAVRIVASDVGGGSDFVARIVAQSLTASLGQQVIVDNRGGGVVPGQIVAKAPADGYTMLAGSSMLWLSPFLYESVPYDPVKDFSPITLATISPAILVVHPSVPVSSVKELIALAKAKPGGLNYASGSAGAPNHLAAEQFKAMAGVDIVRVPYKSGGPAVNDLLGGQVQLMFAPSTLVVAHIKSGRLKALAVSSAAPSALLPGLPTVASNGLPGFEAVSRLGMFAPAKTPSALIQRLNAEMVKALREPAIKDQFLRTGSESVGSSPREFTVIIRNEMTTMGKIIRDAGIRAN